MDKYLSEKVIEGSFIEKIATKNYFIPFLSFILYFDLYLIFTRNSSLINFTLKLNYDIPIGNIIIAISLFSFLTSIILPALFWWCNDLIWSFIERFAKGKALAITDKDIAWLEKSISARDLKAWSMKNSNPTAMVAAKSALDELNKIQNNRVHLFCIACFISIDHFFGFGGLVSELKILSLPTLSAISLRHKRRAY